MNVADAQALLNDAGAEAALARAIAQEPGMASAEDAAVTLVVMPDEGVERHYAFRGVQ